MSTNIHHQPVLTASVLELLQPQAGESYLDLTAGIGGHAKAVLTATQAPDKLVLVDRDQTAIAELKKRFKKATIIHNDYATAAAELAGNRYDMVLMDLGVSSLQFDNADRGFSFSLNGPLDMRMDNSQGMTAADIVNTYSEAELADLIYEFGEERRSRPIARALVRNRPFTTTEQLAQAVQKVFRNYQKIHPATRTFQALRIAVNDELGQLEKTLPRLPDLLTPGGRLAIISFHSLEDRLVKHFLKGNSALEVLNKKVIKGSEHDASNPRARSAKLRGAKKK